MLTHMHRHTDTTNYALSVPISDTTTSEAISWLIQIQIRKFWEIQNVPLCWTHKTDSVNYISLLSSIPKAPKSGYCMEGGQYTFAKF